MSNSILPLRGRRRGWRLGFNGTGNGTPRAIVTVEAVAVVEEGVGEALEGKGEFGNEFFRSPINDAMPEGQGDMTP